MESNASNILKLMPDFDDMMKLSEQIKNTDIEKARLELLISEGEANVFKVAMTDPDFLINGKPPAVSFVKETYKYTGLTGELMTLRSSLIEIIAEHGNLVRKFKLFDQMLDVWRTLSANERKSGM